MKTDKLLSLYFLRRLARRKGGIALTKSQLEILFQRPAGFSLSEPFVAATYWARLAGINTAITEDADELVIRFYQP
jgi:hypothetical protein